MVAVGKRWDIEDAVRRACQLELADREHVAFGGAPVGDARAAGLVPSISQTGVVMGILEVGAIVQGGGGCYARHDPPEEWATRLMDHLATIAHAGVRGGVGFVLYHGRRGTVDAPSRPDVDWEISTETRRARAAALEEYRVWWLTLAALAELATDLPGVQVVPPRRAPSIEEVAVKLGLNSEFASR